MIDHGRGPAGASDGHDHLNRPTGSSNAEEPVRAAGSASENDPLRFMMGEYEARFPTDRQYVKNHMWAIKQSENTIRFGLSAYAIRLLQDVYFLDWTVEPGMQVTHRGELGSIESKKAESTIYAPAAGQIARLNEIAIEDPSAINVEPYGEGWLLEMSALQPELLSPAAYLEHLASSWEIAQKTIKGQANS